MDLNSDLYVGEFFISNPHTHNSFKLMTNLSGDEGFSHIHCMFDYKILSSKNQGKVRLYDSVRKELIPLKQSIYTQVGSIVLAKCTATHLVFIDAEGHAYQIDIAFVKNTIEDKGDEQYNYKDIEKDIAEL